MKYSELFQFEAIEPPTPTEESPATVAASRLVKKSPEQRERVRAYLSGFTHCYEGMAERLDEFVTLFPIHPDYFPVVRQVQFAAPADVLTGLSAVLRALLDTDVPADRLALISYDSYWEQICQLPANRNIADVRAVMDSGREIEKRLPEIVREPEAQALALRIVRALCVHRLTTLSVYLNRGLTPAELRDSLCLYKKDAASAVGSAADNLLGQIVAVFSELHERVPGRRLAINPENFQCYLHLSRFKRFVTQELVLHWVNAVPFLALLGTGVGMMLSRFIHFDQHLLEQVIAVHKVSAIVWIITLPVTVLLHPRIHWTHIREMLTWSRDDFRWMVQSLRNLHNDRAPLLPAGRFNPGQKINACLVMLYFVGFVATGPYMHWQRSILFPWYVHTALFFMAAMSIGGHLFLALINPSTRIALFGIFHGWSPLKYIKHHHALSLPEAAREHAPHIPANTVIQEVRAARRELLLLALALGLFGVDIVAFSNWRIDLLKAHFEKSFADCIQPRALSTKHRFGKTAESCTKCHSYTGEIGDAKCEACHENIKTRRTEQLGYHGTLKGECIHCHTEHPTETEAVVLLDTNKFDHALASFKRDGKHAQVACDECHVKKRTPATPGIYFIGLKHDACTDCHRDPHARQFPDQCERCHTTQGWTGKELKFAHDTDSSFPLTGKHQATECRACHKPAKAGGALASATFKGLSHECTSCHQEPHRKQFTAACTSCHNTSGWGREFQTFEHNRDSQFKLVAKHLDVACEKCHPPASVKEHLGTAQFRNLKQECADCHQEPHRGQFERACTRCHATPVGWAVASKEFDHSTGTKYPLRGKHAAVDCLKCHPPEKPGGKLGTAAFKGLDTRCATCHKVKHPREYGTACTACHTFTGWPAKAPGIGHIFKIEITGENLTGRHLTAECDKCHDGLRVPSLIEPAPRNYQCLTCHQKDDPHKGVLGNQCSKCHGMDGWKGNDLRFDHDMMANFSLDQDHRKVACAKCHTENRWKPLDSRCESCHTQRFLDKRK